MNLDQSVGKAISDFGSAVSEKLGSIVGEGVNSISNSLALQVAAGVVVVLVLVWFLRRAFF
jgi:hypothetical protein